MYVSSERMDVAEKQLLEEKRKIMHDRVAGAGRQIKIQHLEAILVEKNNKITEWVLYLFFYLKVCFIVFQFAKTEHKAFIQKTNTYIYVYGSWSECSQALFIHKLL